jgi:hypothetical protein
LIGTLWDGGLARAARSHPLPNMARRKFANRVVSAKSDAPRSCEWNALVCTWRRDD